MWIVTLAGPVTFPLRGTLAINFIHVGGEAGNNCSNVESVFPIKGKVSHASHSTPPLYGCLIMFYIIIYFLKVRETR